MENKLVFSSIETETVSTQVLDGRKFLVVPVVAVKEMVLNGEFLQGPQIEESVKLWNDVPVSIVHPVANGKKVSAKGIEYVQKIIIGRFYNTYFEANKLKGEMWIDIEKANTLGGDAKNLLDRLQRDEVVEVSTAYFADTSEEIGTYDGNEYSGVQYNIRPDHLAILPGAVGACSVKDGCGAPRVNQGNVEGNIRNDTRTPSFNGVESTSWKAPSLKQLIAGYVKNTGNAKPESSKVEDLPSSVKTWIASKTLLGDASATTLRDLISLPCVNPATNNLNKEALRAIIEERAAQTDISEASITSAQAKAKSLLERKFGMRTQSDDSLLSKIKHLLGVDSMTEKDKMVKAIRDNKIELTDDQVEKTDEAVLQLIVDNMVAPSKVDSKGDAIVEGTEEKTNVEVDPGELAVNEYLKKEGSDIKAVVSFMKAQEADAVIAKKSLVDGLVSNDNCMLTRVTLEGMDVNTLTELTDNFTPGNFLGRGVPGAEKKDVPASPAIVLAANKKDGE